MLGSFNDAKKILKANKKTHYKIEMAEPTTTTEKPVLNKESPYFKENSSDENGIVLFTTCPNQLNWRDVKKSFVEADFGWVDRVDLVPSGKFKKAYIYFEPNRWNMNTKEEEYEALQQGKSLKVFYQNNRFFKVKVATTKKISRDEALKRREKSIRVEIE